MSQATEQAATPRLSGREAAIARRQALSLNGKAALKGGTPAKSTSPGTSSSASSATASTQSTVTEPVNSSQEQQHSCSCQHKSSESYSASTTITPAPISAARKRRIEQSLKGRGNAPTARPSGRVRPAPPKVEEGTTLSGTSVTGNQVERTSRVTGNEQGTCRTVTGTEYIGSEQFRNFCSAVPAPAAAKVGVTSTSRGRTVTGTNVDHGQSVTGDDNGTCKRVTGTEYLSTEQSVAFCGTRPEPAPEKVAFGMTARGNAFSGGDTPRNTTVTGNDSGAGSRVTGGSYANPGIPRTQGESSKKPLTSHSSAGSAVRGTQQVPSPSRSRAEDSSSSRVTGSRYMIDGPYTSARRAQPFLPPAMLGVSRTLMGDQITGMVTAMPSKLTGDEYHANKGVTGTNSIAVEHLVPRESGSKAGLAQISGAFLHPRNADADDQSRRSIRLMDELAIPQPASSGGFSINAPARVARESMQSRISGNAYGSSNSRISGSMARAVGLISGTPEFRHRDIPAREVPQVDASAEQAAPQRITGEGRERSITGDAWDRGDRVTGTEGQSASNRNPTQRGMPPMIRAKRQIEKPETPEIRVTGSHGVAAKGAIITLSGGARG